MRFRDIPFSQLAAAALIAFLGVDLVRAWPDAGVVHPDFALRIGFNHLFLKDFEQLGRVYFPHGPLGFLQHPAPALFRSAYLVHWFLIFGLSWLMLKITRRAELPFVTGFIITMGIVVLSKLQLELILLVTLLSWHSLKAKVFGLWFWFYWLLLGLMLLLSFYIRSMPFVLGLAVWGMTLLILFVSAIKKKNLIGGVQVCLAALVFPALAALSWSLLWSWQSFLAYLQAYYHLLVGSSGATALYPANPAYVFLAFGGIIILFWRYSTMSKGFKALLVVISLLLFKYGFGREDPGHLYFILVGTGLLALILVLEKVNRERYTLALAAISLVCVFWLGITQAGGTDKFPFPTWRPFTNLQYFLKPAVAKAHYQTHLNALYDLYKLPATWVKKLEQGTVDFYPWDMGFVAQHEGLNYTPAPVLQAYAAYTPFLDSLNAGHFAAGGSAPDYLIWHGLPRNGTSKTGVLLLQNVLNAAPQTAQAILEDYKRIDTFQQLSLWERRRKPSTQSAADPLISLDEVGRWVPVPASSESLSSRQLGLEPNLWGQLASFFYKAPPLWIDYKLQNGEVVSYRLNRQNAQGHFYLHPEAFSHDVGFRHASRRTRAVRFQTKK
jgi:hypothetical protein